MINALRYVGRKTPASVSLSFIDEESWRQTSLNRMRPSCILSLELAGKTREGGEQSSLCLPKQVRGGYPPAPHTNMLLLLSVFRCASHAYPESSFTVVMANYLSTTTRSEACSVYVYIIVVHHVSFLMDGE